VTTDPERKGGCPLTSSLLSCASSGQAGRFGPLIHLQNFLLREIVKRNDLIGRVTLLPAAVLLIKCRQRRGEEGVRLWGPRVGYPEGRSSTREAGHVEPPGDMGPKFKRDATCSSRGLRQPRILGLSGCDLKSKDAGGRRNPGNSCEKEKERKQQQQQQQQTPDKRYQQANVDESLEPQASVEPGAMQSAGPPANDARGDASRGPWRVDPRGPARSGGLGVLGGLARAPVPSARHRDERRVGRAEFGMVCRW
jgi:hypothetical protein